jgi:hypothetical protein
MTDDEVKLAKVAAEAGMKPFADLVQKMFGGAVEQIGGMWTDAIATRRLLRREKLLRKVAEKSAEAGFDPTTVPDKIWMPIVQGALVEEEESLQDIWANLLANAANPRQDTEVHPAFARILEELAPEDALFLNNFYDSLAKNSRSMDRFELWHPNGKSIQKSLDVLLRNGLFVKGEMYLHNTDGDGNRHKRKEDEWVLKRGDYELTDLGELFVLACRAPKPVPEHQPSPGS